MRPRDGMVSDTDRLALERAAKYICNFKDGLCPMVVEGYSCRSDCGLETLPWQCWAAHFREKKLEKN